MMTRQQAIDKLLQENCSLVIVNGDLRYVGHKSGVRDLYELLHDSPYILNGAFIADKVVGKGAAALMILGKVQAVYANVISRPALALLHEAHMPVTFGLCVDNIINRTHTGICPVEQICTPCSTPQECLPLIENFLASKS